MNGSWHPNRPIAELLSNIFYGADLVVPRAYKVQRCRKLGLNAVEPFGRCLQVNLYVRKIPSHGVHNQLHIDGD
jgi:hypothetical protein